MTAMSMKTDSLFYNPLDIIESVIMDRDWMFDRPDDGELIADATGKWGKYNIWCAWQEEHSSLTLACNIETKLTKAMLPKLYELIAIANDKLWLGHFGIDMDEMQLAFRHTLLLGDDETSSTDQLRNLLDQAVEECERLYPALQTVVWGGLTPEQAMEIAMFETVAEA